MPALLLLLTCSTLGQLLGPPPAPPLDLDLFRVSTATVERVAGRQCLVRRDYDEAIRHFDASLQEQPDDVATLLDRAKARTDKEGADDIGAIFADLARAIELDPKNATAWARRGAIRRDQSEDPRVDADLAEALRLDPNNVEALMTRGMNFMGRDQLDRALADYDAAIRLGSRDANLFECRAMIRLIRKDPAGALVDIDEAARIESPRPDQGVMLAHFRSTAHLAAERYDQALLDIDAMLRLAPGNTDVLTMRVKTLEALGRYPEARATCDGLIRANPRNIFFWHLRAILHRQEGDYAAALADIEAGLKVLPTYAAIVISRGVIETRQHQYARALADYQSVVAWDPGSITIGDKANALSGLAWIYATCPDARFRDGAKAVEAGTRACELTDWKNALALENLAAAHAESGHFDKAIELAEAVLKIPPSYGVTKQVDPQGGRFFFTYEFPPTNQAKTRQMLDEAHAGYRNHQPYRDVR